MDVGLISIFKIQMVMMMEVNHHGLKK